ncbi:MAG TPA: HAD-IA family hydrolase [Thermoanaerobaculia bacterium]|nr:HAD-IA family hydrolase [Thermoanaerobaculia bacterium]
MTTSLLRYRAVLFDLDGTLVDSYPALSEAVNFARREHGLGALSEARIRGCVGDGIEKLLERTFGNTQVPPGFRTAFESRYDEVCCAQSKVLGGVESTLAALTALDVPMAVCTNKPTFFSKKILDSLMLARHFRAIVGPDLAGAQKPDPRHLLFALAATECQPSEALFVGDMTIDVHAARNSGIHVAVVASGSSPAEELKAAGPDHYLDRFADLVAIVRNGAAA